MTTIITRVGKGTPLTNDEMDANLNNLNNDKQETATAVTKDSQTGAAHIPNGTTAERPVSPQYGDQRANSDLNQQEWWNGSEWAPMGGGATGAPGNYIFFENDITVTADYTITSGKNAMSAGPITIADGVTVTIPDGSTWTIT